MLLEGHQINQYRFIRLLRSGGMGEVYLAYDEHLARQVAVKVIRTDTSRYPDAQAAREAARLFLREMQAIARLDHMNILPVYGSGEKSVNGAKLMFMVMPYRRQGSLADWLQKRDTARPLSLKDTERIVKQAANALQHAHNHRIIHQDIKPSNFLIQGEAEHPGQLNLQLADFGVAKLMTTTSESQTIRGTPTYMAPEQWDGHPVPATDQYALAVMTYELLTGYPPFIANNNHQMWHLHFHVPPQPPSAINPTIPQELDAVLLRALSKNPDERYRSVAAFARAFQQAMPNSDRPLANNSMEGAASPVTRPKVAPTVPVQNANDEVIPFSQRRRGLVGKGIFLIFLALVLIGASILGFLVLRSYPSKNSNPIESNINFKATHIVSPRIGSAATTGATTAMTATAQANGTATAIDATATGTASEATATAVAATATATIAQATATAVAATATAYTKTVTPGSPALNDPLQSNSGNNWDVTNLPGGGGCAFTGGAYHASMPQKGYIAPCFAQATSFSNFTYQVQMTIVKGDQGGIACRANSNNGAFYYFHINQNGTYGLETYSGYNSTAVLKQGTSPAIKTGLNQINLITVVANGNGLVLYVNKQQIASVNDGTYSNGQIGVIAESTQNPTEVVFKNAEVWTTQ
jgi:serine/threonine protein kinase